jgi:hypothetical protein
LSDVGAVGRLVVSNAPTGDPDLLLDLKGKLIYIMYLQVFVLLVPQISSVFMGLVDVESFDLIFFGHF